MKLLDELFAQIAAKDYVGIEKWADRCEEQLPIIEDKWRQKYGVAGGPADYPDAAS